ncbi:MAG TPA: SHOCT domain-containing protein [Acidimicrobiales bacterium]|nr:SHOCT domain-containing protein [Acidimicrobiales bacterium]
MSEPAGWQPDPFGRHEVRYWDGSAWTAHVSDAGVTGTDEPVPSPDGAPPPPPPPAPGGGGWRDKLKQVADQGKELAEKGKQALAEQQAKQAAAAANDPNTVWVGEKKSAGTAAIGVSTVRYRITKDKIYVESGLMSSVSEQVPLWAVLDVDVRQNLMQRPKNIGDVAVMIDSAQYPGHSGSELLLDNIEDPFTVRDLLNAAVSEARAKKQVLTQTQYLQHSGPAFDAAPAAATPAATASPVDVADQLRKLAELRDQGILTDEEFAMQKQKLLGL